MVTLQERTEDVQNNLLHHRRHDATHWAAWYNTWLLIKLTLQGALFSFVVPSFHDVSFGFLQDEPELEVFDNWEGQPGAAVMAGGKSSTRESK